MFFIDIIFNFHTSFVGVDGAVIVDQAKIRRNYLRSGFAIDVMACLPYDALNMFDDFFDDPAAAAGNAALANGVNASSGILDQGGYGNIFSILKVLTSIPQALIKNGGK